MALELTHNHKKVDRGGMNQTSETKPIVGWYMKLKFMLMHTF